MSQDMKLAILQSDASVSGPQARIQWLTDYLERTELSDVDILVLPELFQSGYNIAPNHKMHAESADGEFYTKIGMLCRQHGVSIVYGYCEKAKIEIYNSACVIGPKGQRLCHYRKQALPPGFEKDTFARGERLETFTLGSFTIGILICYDAEFPENVRKLAQMGTDLVIVPTALSVDWDVVATKIMPTRAFENGIYLAYANYCGCEGDRRYLGKSCIISPTGTDVVRAGEGVELIQAKLKKSDVAAAQARLPYLVDAKNLN